MKGEWGWGIWYLMPVWVSATSLAVAVSHDCHPSQVVPSWSLKPSLLWTLNMGHHSTWIKQHLYSSLKKKKINSFVTYFLGDLSPEAWSISCRCHLGSKTTPVSFYTIPHSYFLITICCLRVIVINTYAVQKVGCGPRGNSLSSLAELKRQVPKKHLEGPLQN